MIKDFKAENPYGKRTLLTRATIPLETITTAASTKFKATYQRVNKKYERNDNL